MPSWILAVALLTLPAKLVLLEELRRAGLQARRALRVPDGLLQAPQPTPEPGVDSLPVNVLVAFRDERAGLPGLLESLAAQSCGPGRFRVILVDDGSRDGGPEWLRRQADAGLSLTLQTSPGQGKTAALAHGVQGIPIGLILYTDGDCRPEPDWVRAHLEAHAAGARIVLGHVLVTGTRMDSLESLVASAQLLAGSASGRPPFSRGGNWSLRAEDLHAVGAYRDLDRLPSGDDLYLLQRLLALAPPVAMVTAAGSRVHTLAPTRGSDHAQQRRRRYGKLPGLRGRQRVRHLVLALAFGAMVLEGAAGLAGWAPWAVWQLLAFWAVALWALRACACALGETRLLPALPWLLPLWPLLLLAWGSLGTLGGYRWRHPADTQTRKP